MPKTERLPCQNKPCSGCPFRKDTTPLPALVGTLEQIVKSEQHTCHKTANLHNSGLRQCAGHMLFFGTENSFVLLATRIGVDLKLSGKELIFSTIDEMMNHHLPT